MRAVPRLQLTQEAEHRLVIVWFTKRLYRESCKCLQSVPRVFDTFFVYDKTRFGSFFSIDGCQRRHPKLK